MEAGSGSDLRCPVCGRGFLGNIAYDANPSVSSGIKQAPESHEVLTFSCGHSVRGWQLDEAASVDPNVERRETDETVERSTTEEARDEHRASCRAA